MELKKAKQRLKDEEAQDREAENGFHKALSTIEAELGEELSEMSKLERREKELRRRKEIYEVFYRMQAEQEAKVQ